MEEVFRIIWNIQPILLGEKHEAAMVEMGKVRPNLYLLLEGFGITPISFPTQVLARMGNPIVVETL